MFRFSSAFFLVATALAALPAPAGAQGGASPAAGGSTLAPVFDELVEMTRQGEWGATEWARGSVLGLRLFRTGPPGVPYLRGRFLRSSDPSEAFLSGSFVAIHGATVDHKRLRTELETSGAKRAWLRSMVGDGQAMTRSLRQGEQWRQAVNCFPSLGGCRSFCVLCMQSKDALVRRAGLYWGFWADDAVYWQKVLEVSRGDPDALTRGFATHLYKQRNR